MCEASDGVVDGRDGGTWHSLIGQRSITVRLVTEFTSESLKRYPYMSQFRSAQSRVGNIVHQTKCLMDNI